MGRTERAERAEKKEVRASRGAGARAAGALPQAAGDVTVTVTPIVKKNGGSPPVATGRAEATTARVMSPPQSAPDYMQEP